MDPQDADTELVELDTWTEEDGVEDPFEMEDELPADGDLEEVAPLVDGYGTRKVGLPQPLRGSSMPDLPKVSVSSLRVPKILR